MKNMACLTLLLCLSALCGCATMRYNYKPDVVDFISPQINVETTVRSGDEMFTQGRAFEQEVLHVKKPVDGIYYDIPAGNYEKTGYDKDYQYFKWKGSEGEVTHIFFADSPKGLFIEQGKKSLCVMSDHDKTYCYTAGYEILKKRDSNNNITYKSFVFGGKEDSIIKINYIERAFSIATFTQTLEIDTKNSDTLEYQGARIKILSASNDAIRYIVQSSFNAHSTISVPSEQPKVQSVSQPKKGIDSTNDTFINLYNLNSANLNLPKIKKIPEPVLYDKYLVASLFLTPHSVITFIFDKKDRTINSIFLTYVNDNSEKALNAIRSSTENTITALEPYLTRVEKDTLLKNIGLKKDKLGDGVLFGYTKKLLYIYMSKNNFGKNLFIMALPQQ